MQNKIKLSSITAILLKGIISVENIMELIHQCITVFDLLCYDLKIKNLKVSWKDIRNSVEVLILL